MRNEFALLGVNVDQSGSNVPGNGRLEKAYHFLGTRKELGLYYLFLLWSGIKLLYALLRKYVFMHTIFVLIQIAVLY
jgi:hypothetical protein